MKRPLSRVSYTVEVPCKNKLLTMEQANAIEISDEFLVKTENIGKFYYISDLKGPVFRDTYVDFNYAYDKNLTLNGPLKLFVEITSRCNLKCQGCYIPNTKGFDQSLDNLKYIVDNAKDSGVISIQILGGEPTLHAGLLELVSYIKSKNIRTGLVTNGYFLDNELVKSLDGYLDYCTISIDGDEKFHNEYRGNKYSFQNAKMAFESLLQSNITPEILMTINKHNIGLIEKVFDICGNNPNYMTLKTIQSSTENDNKDLLLSDGDRKEVAEKAYRLGLRFNDAKSSFGKKRKTTFFGCPGGILTGTIDVNGDVFKCIYARKEKLGNIYDHKLGEIWKETAKKLNDLILKSVHCKLCDKMHICGGFCDLNESKCRFE